ncbi:hypothetical protein [Ruminococcus albus]|uniref:hypothetical protein n=1 Tax=Ruminococcus albus TaxID=1264 RepID=UPI0018AD3C90|nr:hypothetical protein [Ruminococcus albus]
MQMFINISQLILGAEYVIIIFNIRLSSDRKPQTAMFCVVRLVMTATGGNIWKR